MGKIVLEDFNEGNGYYKVNLAYLNNEQVEEIENLVSKWNPTDENIKSCIRMCLIGVNKQRFKDYNTNLKECLAWLEKQSEQKTVNKIEPQPKQEWSVEDRSKIQRICIYLNEAKKYYADITEVRECIDWLKSLKGRYIWKASQEQLEALDSATENCACSEYQDCLRELIGQLKKLREE